MNNVDTTEVLLGFDGSPPAATAVEAGVALIPRAHAWVVNLWVPPFASDAMRRRLWTGSRDAGTFVAAIEREGEHEAGRLTSMGVTLARAGGWSAEPYLRRCYGGEGLEFSVLADKLGADVVVIGSRGLRGARAVLDSVSDVIVHYCSRPVLVVPHPLLTAEYAALPDGPVVVGWDGSAGASAALRAAAQLFPGRELLTAVVDDGAGTEPPPDGQPPVHLDRDHGPAGRAVAAALGDHARANHAAVLVVGTRGRSVAQEILLGSVAMAAVHNAHRPVLVVPASRPLS